MRKRILKFAVIATGLVVMVSCGGSSKTTEATETTEGTESTEPTKVVEQVKTVDNTPTTSVISLNDGYNQHYKRQRITDEERQELRIDNH